MEHSINAGTEPHKLCFRLASRPGARTVEPKATRGPRLGERAERTAPEGSRAPCNAVERSRLPPWAKAGKRDACLSSADMIMIYD